MRINLIIFTIYHGQPYARVDLNPMPESTLTLYQNRLYPLVRDFGFSLRVWECTYFRWSVSNMHLSSKRRSFAYVHVPQSAYTCPWSHAQCPFLLHVPLIACPILLHVPLIAPLSVYAVPLVTFSSSRALHHWWSRALDYPWSRSLGSTLVVTCPRSPMITWPWSRLITSSWQLLITCHWSLLIMGPWSHNPWSRDLDLATWITCPWSCLGSRALDLVLDHVPLNDHPWACVRDHGPLITWSLTSFPDPPVHVLRSVSK